MAQIQSDVAEPDGAILYGAPDEVHGRLADEARDEDIGRLEVKLAGRTHLLDIAVLHDHDAVGHGHGFCLVMGDVNGGGAGLPVDLGDLGAHGDALLGIQVGKGLVHQEHAHLADDGPAHRHALPLAAGKRPGHPVQVIRQAQHLGGFLDLLFDDVLVHALQRQAEGQVIVHRHVGIQGIALEHHRNAALPGALLVGALAVDQKFALADFLQPGDHPQRGGLAAAGGTNENNELAFLDFQVEIVHGMETIGVDFIYVL